MVTNLANNLDEMKMEVAALLALIGSLLSMFIDIFGTTIVVLVFLMLLDVFTGFLTYAILGKFEGKKAAKGIILKIYYLVVIVAAYGIGEIIEGFEQIGIGFAVAFCVIEFISILENGYKVNAKMPKIATTIIEALKEKVGENEHENSKN